MSRYREELERKAKEEERLAKELETVMERACNNLAKGTFADLDNKTVNWPLLYSEVHGFFLAELKKREAEAERGVILKLIGELPAFPGHIPDLDEQKIDMLLGKLLRAKYEKLRDAHPKPNNN